MRGARADDVAVSDLYREFLSSTNSIAFGRRGVDRAGMLRDWRERTQVAVSLPTSSQGCL